MTVEAPPTKDAGQAGDAPTGRSPRTTWILVVCCVAQFMVILDLSIVNVALPSIQSSLNFSSADLQWVVDAYAITFASFLMLGGRAADHFGQRRVFVAALVLFSITSLAGGLAPSSGLLITARGVQGFSCALMAASSLAIITSSFPPGPQLHRAIGLWAAMNGAGGAAGTLLGGVITETLSWRWVLLINPPIGIAAALVAYAVVADRRREHKQGFDLAGAADADRRSDRARLRRRQGGHERLELVGGAGPDHRRARCCWRRSASSRHGSRLHRWCRSRS